MLPLIPIATSLLPELAKWIWGESGEKVSQSVVQVVKAVTGTDDASEADAALRNDPELAARVRIELARIVAEQEQARHQAQIAAFRVDLENTQNARQQTVELAKAGSLAHYASAIMSVVVLGMFGMMTYLVVTKGLPPDSREQANILLGTLGAMAGAAVNYWLGSSIGSTLKTTIIAKGDKNG